MVSFSQWVGKSVVVLSDNGTLFSAKKKQTTKPGEGMEEP